MSRSPVLTDERLAALTEAIARLHEEYGGDALVAVLVAGADSALATSATGDAALARIPVALSLAAASFPTSTDSSGIVLAHTLWMEVLTKMRGRSLTGAAFLGFGEESETLFAYLGPADRTQLSAALRTMSEKIATAPPSEGGFGHIPRGQS